MLQHPIHYHDMMDTCHSLDVFCYAHIHTLPSSSQSSARVFHRTTSSRTLFHTYTPTTFQTQTSRRLPHPSILPHFLLQTIPPLHPRFPSHDCKTLHVHSSNIHKTFSILDSSNCITPYHLDSFQFSGVTLI